MKKELFIAFFVLLVFSISHNAYAYLANSNIIAIKTKIKSVQKNKLNVNGLKLSFRRKLINKIKACHYKECVIIYDKKTKNIISIKPLRSKKNEY